MRARWIATAWLAALALATLGMLAVRAHLDRAHIALVLLLIVLGGSAAGGRALGLALAGASFIAFDWLFLPPYGTLVIANPLNWLVLAVFLITSIVATQLLYRAQEEAHVARARTEEVDRLATLGAETLNAGRAEDALRAIAEVIRSATGADACEIYVRAADDGALAVGARVGEGTSPATAPEGSLVAWVAEAGAAALEHRDGTARLAGARPSGDERVALVLGETTGLLLPLAVRERTVGVLHLVSVAGLRLDPERWRFVDAISYYAALGVERVRLVAEAEHAAALREADRLKDALLAAVSHDLRTPLTTIKALAHDLAGLGDERAHIIEHEADRLNGLVADLLDLSRLAAGAFPVRLELEVVDDLIGAVLQRVEPSLGARRVDVRLSGDDPLLVGRFDLALSARVLVNLVENAAKYAPGPSPIEMTVAREGDVIAIAVADRGPGVAPSEAERIFEPFHRASESAPDVGGAGLGLSIARRLADVQGGRLTYAPRPGGGSVFTLRLTAAELDEALPNEAGGSS